MRYRLREAGEESFRSDEENRSMIKKAIIVAGAVAGLCLMGSPAFASTGDTAAKRDVLDTSLIGPVTVNALSNNPRGDGNISGGGNIGGNGNNVGNNNNGGNGNSNGGAGNNVGAGNAGGNGNNDPAWPWHGLVG
jgi:hypothetical protein